MDRSIYMDYASFLDFHYNAPRDKPIRTEAFPAGVPQDLISDRIELTEKECSSGSMNWNANLYRAYLTGPMERLTDYVMVEGGLAAALDYYGWLIDCANTALKMKGSKELWRLGGVEHIDPPGPMLVRAGWIKKLRNMKDNKMEVSRTESKAESSAYLRAMVNTMDNIVTGGAGVNVPDTPDGLMNLAQTFIEDNPEHITVVMREIVGDDGYEGVEDGPGGQKPMIGRVIIDDTNFDLILAGDEKNCPMIAAHERGGVGVIKAYRQTLDFSDWDKALQFCEGIPENIPENDFIGLGFVKTG